MTRLLGTVVVIAYILLCFSTLALWLPNFLAVNLHYPPEGTYRYLTASGLPFGLLLVTVIARQALKGYFSIVMFFQVLFAGTLLYAGLYAFNYPLQANFFCPAHVGMCVVSVAWNVYHHRQELTRHHRAQAAAA